MFGLRRVALRTGLLMLAMCLGSLRWLLMSKYDVCRTVRVLIWLRLCILLRFDAGLRLLCRAVLLSNRIVLMIFVLGMMNVLRYADALRKRLRLRIRCWPRVLCVLSCLMRLVLRRLRLTRSLLEWHFVRTG